MFRARLMLMTALAAAPVAAKAATDITAVPTAPRAAPTFSNNNPLPTGMIDSFQCTMWSAIIENRLQHESPAALTDEVNDYLAQCEPNTPMS